MKIAVLAGGLSPERDVSLSSGSLIANALLRRGHEVALADVYMDIDNIAFGRTPFEEVKIDKCAPDLRAVKEKRRCLRGGTNTEELIGRGIAELCRAADVTFIALHGGMGENGQLQAFLDCSGIKYTGSGYAGCMLAMDKDISKRLMRQGGVDTAEWVCVSCSGTEDDISRALSDVGLPCVVKPCSCGSSVGVSIVHTEEELHAAVRSAGECGQDIIAERLLQGREFSVGVLCGEALPSIEIIPESGFYDYKNKYQKGGAVEVTPADVSPELEARLRASALAVHDLLRLGAYSRSDFIYDESSGRLVCLEANTLPGMTPTSLLPQEAAAAGIDYDTLCEMIVQDALK